MACPLGEPPIGTHGYGPDMISLFLRLVLEAGVSLRAVPRVLTTINQVLGLLLPVPCWTTGRLWLLRLGHAVLTASPVVADDWVWLIDHSVQIGRDKCLVIVGVRMADLPEPGESLRHEDLELIELLPAPSWTRAEVDQALENAAQRTGSVPRAIVEDHGGDVAGGVALFQQRHPGTIDLYDAKHKAACLLKARLEKNPRWQEFQTCVGQTRCAVQQTELAFLTPPAPKVKSRFMNLERQLIWARHVLANLRDPTTVSKFATTERLKEKFGWMEAFEPDVIEWLQWQQVVDVAVKLVNDNGIHRGAADFIAGQLSQLDALQDSARSLGRELVAFVRSQEALVRPGERLTGSTEVLESCFGKFKQIEKQHSRGGFTQLLLGFGALLTEASTELVQRAMEASRTIDVRKWAAETLGVTVFSQRRIAFAGATKTG
jgi:hypothetical protein